MKISLCSVPVEGAGTPLDRKRSEGPLPVAPKIAIVSLMHWMEKHGYSLDDCDFFDIDMIYPNDEEIRNYFLELNPQVIGLSAVVSTSYQQIRRISAIARETCPDAWIIMGGNLAASSEAVLKNTNVELTVHGDGEIAWVNFLNYVKEFGREIKYEKLKKIKGLCFYNEENQINFNGFETHIPPSEIPFPDYDILLQGLQDKPELLSNYLRVGLETGWFSFDPRAFDSHRKPHVAGVFVSKGCVARCTFCQRSTKGYRTLNNDSLEDHLIMLKDRFDVGFIEILDENFGSNRKHTHEIAELMKKHDLLWIATGVRCRSVKHKDIQFYQEHNCSALKFGVETGSQKILDIMEKNFKLEDVATAIESCIESGVFSPLALMLGMPGETEQTAMETGRFIGRIASLLGTHPKTMGYDLFYALPLPGTPLYEYGEHVGVINTTHEGVGKYLENVTNAGTYKRYYVNLNGAPVKELLFWEWLVKLEASRTYHDHLRKNGRAKSTIRTMFEKNQKLEEKKNPRLSLKYTSVKFSYITMFFDLHLDGNKFIDRLPKWFIYPILKYLGYFEYMVQSLYPSNKVHNIFSIVPKNIERITDEKIQSFQKRKEKSLRNIVDLISNPSEDEISSAEQARLELRRGL